MVTRVDKKPVIYNTTFLRCIRPAVAASNKDVLRKILGCARGSKIPDIGIRQLLDDYEEIDYAFHMFGIDDLTYGSLAGLDDDDDDETIRFARVLINRGINPRSVARSESLMVDLSKVQRKIFSDIDQCYFGTEAVYQLYYRALAGNVFQKSDRVDYINWCSDTAGKILLTQSTYNLIHPTSAEALACKFKKTIDYRVWYAWDMFKKLETISVRLGSRKGMLAHSYYAGVNKKGFEPAGEIEDDFRLPATGYAQVKENVEIYVILGVRYFNVGGVMCVLSHDDCITLATMAQCYYRTAMYFTQANGYPANTIDKATTLIRDMVGHCAQMISSGANFANFIRSMHILSQGEFNDSFEADMGDDLGWRERSANYKVESHTLDPMGAYFHNRALDLAIDRIDRLNTCFMYHALVGDEMLINDLKSKVVNMDKKVLKADNDEWKRFLNFVKAYTVARFLLVNKKKPRVGGDVGMLNDSWAERCISGKFTMPPQADWGKIWIFGEYKYTDYADTWHLEAQDVAYVVKDSSGYLSSKYISDKKIHSELLMAMTEGNILDTLTKSTPKSARERIMNKERVDEVVLTCAPKAENAKPTWKKRVTFAADCEFRKMQAEFDRNCRRIMTFIRGPSLGVDQCILEKQFCDIGNATSNGLEGSICSHDISAWSESMDRTRKFEFEKILIDMFSKPEMINISQDWEKIIAVVNKQGCKEAIEINNGSFQGFDGSSSTLLHSMILIYCIDTARRANIMSHDVKANMATLIDDCIALMTNLYKPDEAKAFWAHLKAMYLKLGFEVDDLKSIFSNIKAIYLSRRFIAGGEVPSDFKVFIKAHSSYEDPLRCSLDIAGDIFGAMRGACDANGDPWFTYYCSCLSVLAELAHNHNAILKIPPDAAAIFALAPMVENGWGFPSIVSWATNDVTDKRTHFNAILELLANHENCPEYLTVGLSVYTKAVGKAVMCIKSQPWRTVAYSNLFTHPFEAIREGPLKPDMLRRNAVQDMLKDIATAQPWVSLLKWNNSATTEKVRELLIQSGPLHAPTLAALVNCMPDNYRLSLVGKAVGSNSVLNLLPNAAKLLLKRRVNKCAQAYFDYTCSNYASCNEEFTSSDYAAMNFLERTVLERDEFYAANGVVMIDHTFPDPVATFTASKNITGSVLSPNISSLRIWDKAKHSAHKLNHYISDKGMYVPRRSGRVWEVTCEHAKGWDTVSQRVAMGLAILARAEADGHRTEGLLVYFIKSWNELSNITPNDTHLIAIHGSIKRLDANPGSANHPLIVNRNILRGLNNKIKTACDAIPFECERSHGNSAHLHDFLAHETGMLCITNLMLGNFAHLNILDLTQQYHISTRLGCIVAESPLKMKTNIVANAINIEIMDGADDYGLLQSCPELVYEIAVPTMKASWVRMINALLNRDLQGIERIREECYSVSVEDLIAKIKEDEVHYSASVILAAEPASRGSYIPDESHRIAIIPQASSSRGIGDIYTASVRLAGAGLSRALSASQPIHILAATIIRSMVWSRLKVINLVQLGKIFYQDPDAEYDLIKHTGKADFWRGLIIEVNRIKDTKALSEIVMSAFRSLGVPGIHILHSNDVKDVTQSVSSFFGANKKMVLGIVGDLVTSFVGRRASDFDKPLIERIVTNNPTAKNSQLRRDYSRKLIDSNIGSFKERVRRIQEDDIVHRGDKRAENKHSRLVELRCRMYVYMAAKVNNDGSVTIDESSFNKIIVNCAKKVCDRLGIEESNIPTSETHFDGTLNFMDNMEKVFLDKMVSADAGWSAYSGRIGAKLAYETISIDSNHVINTKFAVAASEIAPKIHKKVMVTPADVPRVVEPDQDPLDGMGMDEDDDDLSIDQILAMGGLTAIMNRPKKLPIPYWHALYALLYSGTYDANKVNEGLGTSLPTSINPASLREAHLEDYTDDEIKNAFPRFESDFVTSGLMFDPAWLERDEADAYMTDELHTLPVGFLF